MNEIFLLLFILGYNSKNLIFSFKNKITRILKIRLLLKKL